MKVSIIMPVYNQQDLILRALESIPLRDDIETIVIDDFSSDNTYQNVINYINTHPLQRIKLLRNRENKGVGYTKNIGYDVAEGEYIHQLDSDDYLITDKYIEAINELDGSDMVYIDLEINDGSRFEVIPKTRRGYCGGTLRFIRREFLGDTRCPEIRVAEDLCLNEELLKKNPTEKYTRIVAYHYNYPRKGSLYDLMKKGVLKGVDIKDD